MESVQELQAKLDAYRLQVGQVTAILLSDPENAQFRQLKTDLDTVINLTEELVKTRLEADGSSVSTHLNISRDVVPVAATSSIASAPFVCGQRVEAVSGDRPYAAVVIAVSLETQECTVKYFEFETPVVVGFKDLTKIPRGALTADKVPPGFLAQVKYGLDQRWYDAVVDNATEYGYNVTFTQYGNVEEVPLEYIRARLTKKEHHKDENTLIPIPDNLKIQPTDTEEVNI